ncbi:Pro-neuregulin-2 [Nibea albiflora]|uniref:Pro-neuregulin-2 n=1 Tax=Nibea albiflora TaxID=240163 RepID=A0ACB7EQW4_NIBAL|nr:Pro-neuregulin-2 [Nibea albiflora]
MDPTAEPLVFKASYAPVDASEPELKKDVERVLCEDCASAPKLRLTRGQSLMEGDKLYLKCEASGNPSPSFRWYKDGHELQKGRDLKIKTNKKQRKKMHSHLHQNQNQCVEQPRIMANGPQPGPGPEEIPMDDVSLKTVETPRQRQVQVTPRHEEQTWSMERTESMNSDCQSGGLSSSVGTSKCSSPACMARRAAHWGCTDVSGPGMQYGDSYDSLRDSPHSDRYVSALTTPARLSPVEFHYPPLPPQVPTFQITSPNTSHALSLPPNAAAYHRDDDQPLLRCPDDGSLYRQPRRPRRPYLTESTGSLPSSPYRLPDDEAYETTQEYASSREPIRSRRRPRRNRLNGHISQRSAGLRDYSSQSFSQSEEEEEEEEEEDAHGESTPFLSMQNMNMDPPLTVPGFSFVIRCGHTDSPRAQSAGDAQQRAEPRLPVAPLQG